jgi:hypothetical protein
MIWQDVLLEQSFDDSKLRAALAKAFTLSDRDVAIVHAVEDFPAGCPVVAQVRDAEGDFKSAISIYTTAASSSANPVHIVQQICAELRTTALISDESLNPYTMMLVGQGGEVHRVELDAESLDLREEYRLARREKTR